MPEFGLESNDLKKILHSLLEGKRMNSGLENYNLKNCLQNQFTWQHINGTKQRIMLLLFQVWLLSFLATKAV